MRTALLLLAALSPSIAIADVVVLADGQQIRGIVTEEDNTVSVRLDVGNVSFDRSEVQRIEREATPIHELEEKRMRLGANDVAARLALARWAEQQGLAESARDLYREVIALRPNDTTAREALGHKRYEGRWLTEEEYLEATGHVRYGGRWVTRDEQLQLEREAAERREQRQNERIHELESQVAAQDQKIEQMKTYPEPASDLYADGGYGYGDGFAYGFPYLHGQPFFHHRFFGHHAGSHRHHLQGRLQLRRGPTIRPHVSRPPPAPRSPSPRGFIGVLRR